MSSTKTTNFTRATTKTPKLKIEEIDKQFGDLAVKSYSESIYPALFYGLRQSMGGKCQQEWRQKGREFNWNEFNKKFAEVLGDPKESPRLTLEQLIEYATAKTGHSVEELLEINRKSNERRQAWQERKNRQQDETDDEIYSEF